MKCRSTWPCVCFAATKPRSLRIQPRTPQPGARDEIATIAAMCHNGPLLSQPVEHRRPRGLRLWLPLREARSGFVCGDLRAVHAEGGRDLKLHDGRTAERPKASQATQAA